MRKIVIVCTSASDVSGHPTGLWIEELATPYYQFKAAGFDVVIASPAGGPIPIDKNSLGEGVFTDDARKFMHDGHAIGELCHSVKLSTIDFTAGIDAMFMPGGHGTCTDFISNPTLKAAIETMHSSGKVVAAVCHGPLCFIDCTQADGTTPLLQGKTVTGFLDSEEKAVQLEDKVPFLLEAKMREQGANFENANDWNPKCCVHENLVTGQNPQSSPVVAKAVVELLA